MRMIQLFNLNILRLANGLIPFLPLPPFFKLPLPMQPKHLQQRPNRSNHHREHKPRKVVIPILKELSFEFVIHVFLTMRLYVIPGKGIDFIKNGSERPRDFLPIDDVGGGDVVFRLESVSMS